MTSIFRHCLKYLYAKMKWRSKCIFDFSSDISIKATFEGMNKIHRNTSFAGTLGYGSYIGEGCTLRAHIGRFTSIAPQVCTTDGVHPLYSPFATTSPSFFSLNPNKSQNGSTFAKKQLYKEHSYVDETQQIAISIGSDCWIGTGAFFIGGITIGHGAVVLARAVVTKNVPPYAIVGGVPARIIRYRYDEDTIKMLLNIQWWNQPHEWLKENWLLMTDIDKLKSYFYEN